MNLVFVTVAFYLAMVDSITNEHQVDENWQDFMKTHNKNYFSEETFRRALFNRKEQLINDFNELQSERLGFELGHNEYSDRSESELSYMNGLKMPSRNKLRSLRRNFYSSNIQQFLNETDNSDLPDEVDWRKTPGRVTRVKNQGACGSCWAFASTGVLEGQEAVIKRASLDENSDTNSTELSEQNLVDCVKKDYGCNGGFMADALEFVEEEGGIDSEESYPYEARTRKCRFRKDKVVFNDKGAALLPSGDEQKLKEVVAKFGPVAVAIDASSIWFQFYRHGVYYNKHCKNKENQLDHGVLVVGYGTDPKKGDYWIVKNSWGRSYGESGYIRMARNRGNNCGIATAATIPKF